MVDGPSLIDDRSDPTQAQIAAALMQGIVADEASRKEWLENRAAGIVIIQSRIHQDDLKGEILLDSSWPILRPGTSDININCIPQPASSISPTTSRPARGSMQDDWSRYGP